MYQLFPKFGTYLPTTKIKKAEARQLIFFPFEKKCTVHTLLTYLQYLITSKEACGFGSQRKENAEKCMVTSKATADTEQPLQNTFFNAIAGGHTWVGSSQTQLKPSHQPLWYVRQRCSFVWSSKTKVGSQERAGSSSTATSDSAQPHVVPCSNAPPSGARAPSSLAGLDPPHPRSGFRGNCTKP